MPRPALIALLLLSLTASFAGATSSFINGSFETPTANGSFISATTDFGGWTVTDGNVFPVATAGALQAHTGGQFLFLPGSSIQSSEIDQTLTGLMPNVDYEVAYFYCPYNAAATTRSCSAEVVLYNQKIDTFDPSVPAFTNSIGTASNPWQRRSFQFTAEGTSTDLSFDNYRSDAVNGAFIALDDFSIRVVPKGQPSVAFTRKKPKKPTAKKTYSLSGVCSAPLPLASITVTVGHRTLTLFGTLNWSAKIRLKKGVNHIVVTATDIAGTPSAPVTRTIRRK